MAQEGATRLDSVTLGPYSNATMFGLVEKIAKQLIPKVLGDRRAIGSALSEILGGVGSQVAAKVTGRGPKHAPTEEPHEP